jgi:hypothetical protein
MTLSTLALLDWSAAGALWAGGGKSAWAYCTLSPLSYGMDIHHSFIGWNWGVTSTTTTSPPSSFRELKYPTSI